ncbi:MAG: host attachment protein [Xanthomonadaceae bacterium]|nr:host attachment protein [Xanthomonadaceae bacterium]
MTKTWILVADRARARLLAIGSSEKALNEVACFTNPDGRAPGRHATTERAPRVNESVGPARHAIEPHTSLREKSEDHFAHTLIDALERGHHEHQFDQLILVAPAHFLGVMHDCLDKPLRACVVDEIRHDLTALPLAEIYPRLPHRLLAPGISP